MHTENGRKVIGHGGGIDGFNTELDYYPDIAKKLAAVVHGETVTLLSERKEISLPEVVLAKYVGTYEVQVGFDVPMTLEEGQLMTQATGQPKFPVYPSRKPGFS